MSYNLMKTLRNRSILLGRVLPRVQSEIARPTVVMRPTWDVTPRETVVVRVPTLEFDKFFKRVRYRFVSVILLVFFVHLSPNINCSIFDTRPTSSHTTLKNCARRATPSS